MRRPTFLTNDRTAAPPKLVMNITPAVPAYPFRVVTPTSRKPTKFISNPFVSEQDYAKNCGISPFGLVGLDSSSLWIFITS